MGRYLSEKLICFDTETTGFSPAKNEILTMSIIDGEGNALFDGMFKPQFVEAWPGAQEVNNISPEMVADCPYITESLEEIQTIFDEADGILGYNVGFDLGFIREAGIRFDEGKVLDDPMLGFAEVYGEPGRFGGFKWQRLTTAADYIGYTWEGRAHGSLADAKATLALAKWLEAR